ncbi:MAG: ChrR family anti-sigma-E factor [Alphaproteobacteria bacterium]
MLTAYAAGLLAEPLVLLAATHLAMCALCRNRERELRAVGGAMLEGEVPARVSEGLQARVMAALDAAPAAPSRPCARAPGDVPEPLARYVGPRFDQLKWRSRGPVSEIRLMPEQEGWVTRLLKIRPGAAMPDHTHEGLEATLVIRGAFSDCTGRYGPGDVALVQGDLDHSPVAGDEDTCIALAVTDAPLRLTGSFGRFLNPFVRL